MLENLSPKITKDWDGLPVIKPISGVDKTSRHVLLCISGFTSEGDDSKEAWGKVAEYF